MVTIPHGIQNIKISGSWIGIHLDNWNRNFQNKGRIQAVLFNSLLRIFKDCLRGYGVGLLTFGMYRMGLEWGYQAKCHFPLYLPSQAQPVHADGKETNPKSTEELLYSYSIKYWKIVSLLQLWEWGLICNYLNQLIMQNMNPPVIIFSWWWYSTAATATSHYINIRRHRIKPAPP